VIPTQGEHAPDRITLANLEPGNSLPCLRNNRLLPCDLDHVAHGVIQDLLVANRLTDTHVQGDLGDARDLHD
jgi:hypothetical protein